MRRLLGISAMVLGFAACSGGSDSGDPPTTPPTPTLGVQLSSSAGTVARGASATTTATITRGGNYTGTVTLSAANAPSGVTVTFAPATLSGTTTSATATIAVGATAAPGTANLTISAAGSGVTTATSTYSLTVPTPAIALSAGTTTLSVVQGGSGTVPVTITRSNGYADPVTLAVSGLPTGVTGTFAPATIAAGATSSTLSLAVGTGATAGTSTFTITASGTGVTAQTATVSLTITAAATPAFALTATPAALNITAGQSSTASIGIARTGGFAGEVTLALENAPAGLTGTFGVNPVAGTVFASILTLNATAAVAPGTYNLTVRGTGTGVTAQTTAIAVTVGAPPGITLSTAPATLSVTPGAATTTTITITRVGGFAGAVALAATGLPTGVTAAFAPASLTGTTLTSTLTLTAAANAAIGAATITITASGTGITAQSSSVALSVAAAQGYTLAASATSLTQGGTGTSTVMITRTGGFAGTVNLAVSGLPSGVTAVVNPAAVTGTSATITFTAAAGATTGAFSATVTGTATGLANVTTTVAGTVNASGGGGSGNVVWTFCDPTELPLLVAFRNGKTGAWSRATGDASNTYRFNITNEGGVAIVKPLASGTADVVVWYGTAAQLIQVGQEECTSSPATKTLTGSFAGLSGAQVGSVSIGGGFAQSTPGAANFTVPGVAIGTTDLLAFRSTPGVIVVPDRGILRRDVNYASTIPTLDFNGSDSFAPASAQVTVNNAGAGFLTVFAGFETNTASFGSFNFGALFGGSNPFTVYGVPANLTRAGDFHLVQATSTAIVNNFPSETRSATAFNQNLANRTLTLGPSLTLPTYATISSAPYVRVRASGTWQQEYGDQLYANFQQQISGAERNWTVFVTRAYTGAGAAYEAEIPDLASVTGWNNAWGIQSGTSVTATVLAFSAGNATTINEGVSVLTAGRFGTYTP